MITAAISRTIRIRSCSRTACCRAILCAFYTQVMVFMNHLHFHHEPSAITYANMIAKESLMILTGLSEEQTL
jgi:hypothetical protein